MKLLNTRSCFFQESDLRLDASFHLSDGPLTKLKLNNSPFEISTLGKETKNIFKGNIFKRVYVSSALHGFPFMTASDMMKTDINSGKFVSKKYTKINNFENLWTNKTKYVEVYDLLFAERKNLLKYSAEWAVDLN